MQVDTMRRIDYWAGIPLCLLATPLVKLFDLFRGAPSAPPRNVLFIELSEMGSTILVDPAMRKLQRETGANLHFAIFAKNKPSLDLLRTVPAENIFTLRENGLLPLATDTLRFLAWCRARRIDTVIDLELFSRFTALLTGLSGAGRRLGFHAFFNEGLYRGDLLTHRVAYNPHLHIARNFVALVNTLLAAKQERPYSKTVINDAEIVLDKAPVDPAAVEAMRAKIHAHAPAFDAQRHRLVLVNANASDLMPLRRWAKASYIALIRRLLDAFPDCFVLLTGAPPERDGLQEIADAAASERCANFAGLTGFDELVPLYAISELMLTNDSGPAHFAAVTGMPTYVFFGPETPRLYGSLGLTTPIYAGLACSPCVSAANHRKSPCDDNVCLQVITTEQVFEVLKPALSGSRFGA